MNATRAMINMETAITAEVVRFFLNEKLNQGAKLDASLGDFMRATTGIMISVIILGGLS
jgi:hypothetical protein